MCNTNGAASAAAKQETSCFIFGDWNDAQFYGYLKNSDNGEIAGMMSEAIAEAKDAISPAEFDSELFDPEEVLNDKAAEILGDKLKEWIAENSPLTVFPDEAWQGDDIYERLLSAALSEIDFETVALAFLEDVESPTW